jgi:hypothetical protein
MSFLKIFKFRTNFKKTGGLPKPYPGGFGKPTGLPPVFTSFVNRGEDAKNHRRNGMACRFPLICLRVYLRPLPTASFAHRKIPDQWMWIVSQARRVTAAIIKIQLQLQLQAGICFRSSDEFLLLGLSMTNEFTYDSCLCRYLFVLQAGISADF